MPYRLLRAEQKFSKYQWIEARVQKARNDTRLESFNPDRDSIKPLSGVLSTDKEWQARKDLVYPLKSPSLCQLMRRRDQDDEPTLGIFKPALIKRLIIEEDAERDWTADQKNILSQGDLFDAAPKEELKKIPFKFRYEFECSDAECNGHKMICTDWEMGELYRKVQQSHGEGWQAPFRKRYEQEMIQRFDTHFYVGTLHQYPDTWIVVGLFYPLPVRQQQLF
ncbi:MAG: hypothetical protein IVW54_15190 [Candidatus Binataceae bacterium]|nr:hypothetical protein [Candidatus Binataceae bacterium]